ncbi:SRPBCC family protein [Brevibacterium picturae]|uniref:SRPBCC family protein n=1 Tax=Brevibacterium picturae TaxID=260553 RepID=A0ABN2B2G6_9MICO
MPTKPLIQAQARTVIESVSAVAVYEMISDLPSQSRWSSECRGGRWISGEPAQFGARFEGNNHRDMDVVAWAPVVRGDWSTVCEIVSAVPGSEFAWAMLDSLGNPQQSIWSFVLSEKQNDVVLEHRFVMQEPTEGIASITADMSAAERTQFFEEWERKVAADLRSSVDRIRELFTEILDEEVGRSY